LPMYIMLCLSTSVLSRSLTAVIRREWSQPERGQIEGHRQLSRTVSIGPSKSVEYHE
jgi:hypothetical protein